MDARRTAAETKRKHAERNQAQDTGRIGLHGPSSKVIQSIVGRM
jgi:hypothetical protein